MATKSVKKERENKVYQVKDKAGKVYNTAEPNWKPTEGTPNTTFRQDAAGDLYNVRQTNAEGEKLTLQPHEYQALQEAKQMGVTDLGQTNKVTGEKATALSPGFRAYLQKENMKRAVKMGLINPQGLQPSSPALPTGQPATEPLPGQQSLITRDQEFEAARTAKATEIENAGINGRNYVKGAVVAKSVSAQMMDLITFGPITKITKKVGSTTGAIEDSFANAGTLLDTTLDDLDSGVGSIEETEYQINKMKEYIAQMDSISKGEGEYDVQYWKDFGLSVHEQANLMQNRLNQALIRLQTIKESRAMQQAAVQSMINQYGLGD